MTKNKGLKRIMMASLYSLQGIGAAFKHEMAFRQEVLMALILIPLAFVLEVEVTHRILMFGSVLLVMVIELINTAIEAVVDRIGSEFHELAGRAKDTGSAAVALTIALAMYVWGESIWVAYW